MMTFFLKLYSLTFINYICVMKNILLNITLFLSILFACNSVDPTPEPDDPLDIQANLLNGTWVLKDASSAVKEVTMQLQTQLILVYGQILDHGNFRITIRVNC